MMRRLFKTMGIAAAAAMLATGTAASAEAASTPPAKATETVDNGSALHSGVGSTTLIEIGILAALTAIIIVATRHDSGNNNSRPNSP